MALLTISRDYHQIRAYHRLHCASWSPNSTFGTAGSWDWVNSNANFAMWELTMLLLLSEIFRYPQGKNSKFFPSLFLPWFTVDRIYFLVSQTLSFISTWLALINGMWVDITVFHFLNRDFKMGCMLPIALLHSRLAPREHPKWMTLFQLWLSTEKAYGPDLNPTYSLD